VFLLAAGLPTALLALKTLEIVFAAVCLKAGTVSALRRALSADPGDPELYDRLGQARLYGFMNSNPRAALEDFRKATSLAPNRTAYWEDLALASESVNDSAAARAAFDHAINLSPVSPRAHWLAANFDLNAGNSAQGLRELQEVLRLGSGYSGAVFEICDRVGIDPLTVESRVLPAGGEPAFRLDYANFLVNKGQASAAAKIWRDTVATGRPFAFSLAQPYIDSLMRVRDYTEAHRAWADLEHLGVIQNLESTDPGEFIFNGGFERQPLNAGFDWHYEQAPYVQLDFADTQAYMGHRCLRMDFTVPSNGEYEPIYQDLVVDPGQTYVLTAFVRSGGITSDSGPRLRIVDLVQPSALEASTEQTIGTTDWHAIEARFTTGPATHYIQISIWRPRGVNFPGQISGTFWLDSVSLKRVS
jgi:tetratricopeptide (TPR) repeat protein